jgi:hypothetical protein
MTNTSNKNTNNNTHRHNKHKKQKLSIAAQNLRGLGSKNDDKLEEITQDMDDNNIDIMILTETWTDNRDEERLDSDEDTAVAGHKESASYYQQRWQKIMRKADDNFKAMGAG